MKRVLILGGGGRLGSRLAKILGRSGYDIVITRHNRSSDFHLSQDRNVLVADLSIASHWAKLAHLYSGAVLIDCVAIRNPLPNPEIRDLTTFAKEVRKTSHMLEFIGKFPALCILSSASVHSNVDDSTVPYGLVCDEIESFVKNVPPGIQILDWDANYGEFKKAQPFLDIVPPNHTFQNLRLNGLSKYLCELVFIEVARNLGFSLTILRPPRITF